MVSGISYSYSSHELFYNTGHCRTNSMCKKSDPRQVAIVLRKKRSGPGAGTRIGARIGAGIGAGVVAQW